MKVKCTQSLLSTTRCRHIQPLLYQQINIDNDNFLPRLMKGYYKYYIIPIIFLKICKSESVSISWLLFLVLIKTEEKLQK